METLTTDNPGDCQAVAADSTTSAVVASSEQRTTARTRSAISSEDVSSSTTAATAAATSSSSSSTATAKQGASTPPTTTTAAVTHANNNSKIKTQQQQQLQQQQQQQQKFQFRAPQQFVKHRKATSMLAKKNKTWNKRQNKCNLQKQQQQQQQQQQVTCTALTAGGVVSGLGLAAAVAGGTLPATKADLENIQNLKNQLGSGGHHHQYHHHHGGHHGGGRGGGGGGSGSSANGIAPCLCALDKLGYGHGHLKQQLYKKMLAHRGHHHHVLCAGAAHNASGGGGGTNSACCLINGCTVQNGKDSTNSNAHNNSSHANITHYCCGRSKFFLPDKRPRKEVIIPPTKFLLGGTISDPLNLNSLQNESASNVSSNNNTPATTPRQSPITTPPKVEVIIPPNIYDPLHLLDPVDSMEYEKQLTSPMKRKTKASTKKHRHRKNRKPKRRRYESYNSTTMEEDALSLAGSSNATIANTSLANSTLMTDVSTTSNITTMSISLSLNSVENTSGVGTSAVGNEEHEEKRNSPAPHGAELIGLSSTPTEQVEKNHITLSPSTNQQHVAGVVMPEAVGAVEMLNVRRTSERERVSKDLRLDLSMCGVSVSGGGSGSGAGNNHNNNNNNNSASSSTCGSIGTLLGSAGLGCSGRKRKISESSNSQKNKKFHRVDSMDKIVSPVVPQPGAWKRPPRLVPTGARKPSRRSTSVSETELLSPADETNKTINDSESNRGDTPDLSKMEPMSEAAIGSPLSTASGATSVTAGEQDSMPENNVGEAAPMTQVAAVTTASSSVATTATTSTIAQLTKMPKFRADGAKYQYGNYDRYAGFLHLNEFMDVRLQVFQRHLELFKNKDILDIGCNVGHMTITVARSLAPKSILGIDIDKELIARARRNLSMYVRIPAEARVKHDIKLHAKPEDNAAALKSKRTRRQKKKKQHQQQAPTTTASTTTSHMHHHHHHLLLHHQHHQQHLTSKMHVDAAEFFPVSFPINYGGMPDLTCAATPSTSCGTPGNISGGGGGCAAASSSTGVCASGGSGSGGSAASKSKNDFPKNVFFRHNNYVLKDEALLNNDSQQYDLIMCLSVTKWIHLNFGDNGLKMAFKRMFNQLRPGGKLILEAQNWASYKKKKNLTEQIYNNYSKIEFFPNKFHEYLLSSEVGFSHSYTLGAPRHLNKGFCRPIQLYAKGDYTPNHVRWSDAYYPQTPYEAYRGIYATMAPRTHPLISSSRSQNYDTPHHPGIGGGGGGGGGGGPGSGSYSCRQTPMHQPTSQYYNPLETDSYLPSYDMEYLNHLYVFASPLYQTVWSPPASLRNSSTHTPLFGSVRDAELDGDVVSGGSAGGGSYHRHVYPPNDDTSSPNANAGGAFSSIRDPDTDDSNQLPASSVQHVYATNCESSSSPQVLHPHDSEPIDVSLMLADEAVVSGGNNCCGDSNEA